MAKHKILPDILLFVLIFLLFTSLIAEQKNNMYVITSSPWMCLIFQAAHIYTNYNMTLMLKQKR